MKVKKAVIAAAGFGTRFLPATKAVPKEMLPVLDKPIIQYLVEEVASSGIKKIIIVTRAVKGSLKDHFSSNFELERGLEKAGKEELLKEVRKIHRLVDFVFARQSRDLPYGNGTPLLAAQNLIDENEPFVYMFGDDLVLAKIPAAAQLIRLWERRKNAVFVACREVASSEVSKYGIVKLKKGSTDRIEMIIEKPTLAQAPSRLSAFGRFLLKKEVIKVLKKQKTGKGGELWLMDALTTYAKENEVLVARIKGKLLTTGDPLNWLKANIEFGLQDPEIRRPLRSFLKKIK